MRPASGRTVQRLEDAYFDSYGTPRSDKNKPGPFRGVAPGRERVRGAQGCLELLFKINAPGEELFMIEGGRLTVDQKSATKELRKAVGADRRISKIVKSRAKLPEPPHEEVPPEVVEALRELRDLRDATDLPRTHPQLHLLSQAIESLAAKGNPQAPRDVAYLRLLVKRVESEKDPSLKAALVYEGVGGNRDQQELVLSRAVVAKHYKVTARKIETRAAQARWEVQRLVQLAS
jgi:hypothetical protein